MNRNGILITAYKQKDLTFKCIDRFNNFAKSKYYFVVISTSEEDVRFRELTSYFDNVKIVEWFDAPKWNIYHDTDFPFKIIRILMSIQKGLKLFEEIGIKKVLHIHSDTYWKKEKEDNLINLFEELDKFMIIGDIDVSSESQSILPKNLHFHPEGLMFNLDECKKYGYGFNFELILSPYSRI